MVSSVALVVRYAVWPKSHLKIINLSTTRVKPGLSQLKYRYRRSLIIFCQYWGHRDISLQAGVMPRDCWWSEHVTPEVVLTERVLLRHLYRAIEDHYISNNKRLNASSILSAYFYSAAGITLQNSIQNLLIISLETALFFLWFENNYSMTLLRCPYAQSIQSENWYRIGAEKTH